MTDKTVTMRLKEKDPSYLFMRDPDLPRLYVDQERIDEIAAKLEPVPFERKKQLKDSLNLQVSEIQTVFIYENTIELFEKLCEKFDPKLVH